MPKKIPLDVAAENASADSLSFAGLLCVVEDKSVHAPAPPPTNNAAKSRKEDLDFEFGSATTPGSIPDALNNDSLADVLFSNGQIVPRAIPLQASRSSKASPRAPRSSSRRSGATGLDANESAKKTSNGGVRNKANKQLTTERNTESQWFGQKIMQSFATHCRDCRAIQPSALRQ